ncbi:glutathione S-transferase family protein [Bradyrhizobium sp. Leo170]|uniref:glutathione S-transferase family protein n=1 Tax=Bradyrhizobium sp. Leo170 TaxID=1571199 RepID=UPI001FE16546|nr:glutathione S-transferase family protein [Bradyrhizobium sp. Leo170]
MSDAIELFYAPTSPYVRKVMACAIELGITDRIVRLPSAAHPLKRDERIAIFNPLAKVPAAKLADGTLLFDSRVICEYLDDLGKGSLFPRGPQRWQVLTEQALGDGLLDAALLTRYENTCRSDEHRSADWIDGQMTKIAAALDQMENTVAEFGACISIGSLTIACALGYLDFRFASFDWRTTRPALAVWFETMSLRPSLRDTFPTDG